MQTQTKDILRCIHLGVKENLELNLKDSDQENKHERIRNIIWEGTDTDKHIQTAALFFIYGHWAGNIGRKTKRKQALISFYSLWKQSSISYCFISK